MYRFFALNSSLSGNFSKTTARQKIGDIDRLHACAELSRRGMYISILCPDGVSGLCALELIEMHQKADAPFLYRIFINGKAVHTRSMEPVSDSLFPAYTKLTLAPGDEIRIQNETDAPVRFTGAGIFTSLPALMKRYLTPMEIGLCFPRPSFTNRDADLSVFRRIFHDFKELRHFTVAPGIEIPYMKLSDDDLQRQLLWVISLAREAGLSLIFNFNTWWDGTPSGRDGTGGYFSDAQYQQVVYDPASGKTYLSIPNLWRNTPWYTMNSEQLNTARKERLSRALCILTQTAAENDFGGKYRIFIDNEPTYWAEFAYSCSPEAGGDFSCAAIRAASKDGVELTPEGAVTPIQKAWLLNNHSKYISDLAGEYCRLSARETAVLDENGLHYTNNHVSENTFTHIFPHTGYPYADGKHLMFEQHVTRHARLGLECAGFQDDRILGYACAIGRFGQVNAERCCYTDPRFHLQFYSFGASTDIIFNYFYDTDVAHMRMLDTLVSENLNACEYGRCIFEFNGYSDTLESEKVVGFENIALSPLRERYVLRPERLGTGSITFKIGSTCDFPFGGWLDVYALIRPANGVVRLHWGDTPDCIISSETLSERDADYQHIPMRIPLKPFAGGASDIYIKLEIESGYYDDWAQMNAVWRIRAVSALHADKTTAEPFTRAEMRALTTHLSLRMDIERLYALHPFLSPPPLSDASDPMEEYTHIMHRLSVSQTRSFHVRACGKIERFAVEILSVSNPALLTFPDENARSAYLEGPTGTRMRLKDKNGEWALTASDAPMPARFHGTFLEYDHKNGMLRAATHALKAWAWQPYLDFPCPEETPVSIQPSALCGELLSHQSVNPYTPVAIREATIEANPTVFSLKRGDAISLSVENGKTASIKATRGITRGRLVSFSPMTLLPEAKNALLTLEITPGLTACFELGAQTHLNYTKAPCENALLAGRSDLGLDMGCTLLISFEAEAFENRPLRATEITVV